MIEGDGGELVTYLLEIIATNPGIAASDTAVKSLRLI
jgi:hypothetical protein